MHFHIVDLASKKIFVTCLEPNDYVVWVRSNSLSLSLSLWLYNGFLSLADSAEKPTHIRFLVSNAAAGSVIGKGGSTITEFQAKSGARIQLSRNQEFFPGTTDRIIMISGSIKEVVNGLELILDKLHSEVISQLLLTNIKLLREQFFVFLCLFV